MKWTEVSTKGRYHLKYAGIFFSFILLWFVLGFLISALFSDPDIVFKSKRFTGYVLLFFIINFAIKYYKGAKNFEKE